MAVECMKSSALSVSASIHSHKCQLKVNFVVY